MENNIENAVEKSVPANCSDSEESIHPEISFGVHNVFIKEEPLDEATEASLPSEQEQCAKATTGAQPDGARDPLAVCLAVNNSFLQVRSVQRLNQFNSNVSEPIKKQSKITFERVYVKVEPKAYADTVSASVEPHIRSEVDSRAFILKRRFERQRWIKEKQSYGCEICGKVYSIKSSLDIHIRGFHQGIKNYECEECGKTFCVQKHLTRHLNAVHRGQRNWICTECGMAFFQRYGLRRHQMGVHENVRDFVCEHCGKKFGRKSNLDFHVKSVHKKIKDYACEICDKKFVGKHCLAGHLNSAVHRNVRDNVNTVNCSDCGKVFGSKFQLTEHLNSAHLGIVNFTCTVCRKSFSRQSFLNRHVKSEHASQSQEKRKAKIGGGEQSAAKAEVYNRKNVKLFACDYCKKQFAYKISIINHIQFAHEKRLKAK